MFINARMMKWMGGCRVYIWFIFFFSIFLFVSLSICLLDKKKKKKKKKKLSTVYAAMEKLGGCYAHQTDVG